MRTKIQLSFHELPQEAHGSLRDSLMEHISQINEHTNSAIVTQVFIYIFLSYTSVSLKTILNGVNFIKTILNFCVSSYA